MARMSIGIGKRLRRAHAAFSRSLRLSLMREGFSFSQFVHLERLWEEDGLTQAELSRRVGVEMASSTKVLAELDQLKLIKRTRNKEDRREVLVFLTPAGRQLKTRLLRRVAIVNKIARTDLSEAEVAALYKLLESVIENLADFSPELTD